MKRAMELLDELKFVRTRILKIIAELFLSSGWTNDSRMATVNTAMRNNQDEMRLSCSPIPCGYKNMGTRAGLFEMIISAMDRGA